MIPKQTIILSEHFELDEQTSRTYRMELEQDSISDYCDELRAVEQAIYKILNTERYQYNIYSHNYGIELADLFGEPITYAVPEIERRITEALTQDERVISVDNFNFDTSKKRTVYVTFTAHTIYGDINAERGVNI